MKTIKITLLSLATLLVISCNKESADTTEATTDNVENAETLASNDAVETATPVLDETADPSAAPVLSLESDTYDFGDVQANSTTERVVEFTNTGEGPLIIKSAKASCGCTVPEYSETPIAPGEKGSLKVSFKAPGNNGKQTKTVTLTTNTPKSIETFKIQANVVGGSTRAPQPQPMPQPQPLPAPALGQ
ncbi:DUF1573 domain-containing protein [Weeksellaceae bacterium KMM 9724]|uniref:DUF1573 domain-containing protein n=1 Tax=Profundicola chukchiensis TaxID=2961959 RepID=UPI0024382257|nr:DUF1573 domain-containing protein [Profundicola chukchiensis]MDG4949969.1 DUF1573 domain-containing protein [Profundicola chukchiensis]